MQEPKFVLQKEPKELKYKHFRNTIHFCINGEVTSHIYGGFDNMKYAIVIPLTEELMSKMVCFNVVDTYFNDSVSTIGGYILCPKDEYELIKNNNPNTSIIPYMDEYVDGYAEALLNILGYQCEEIGMWNWSNASDSKRINEIREKYPIKGDAHSYSEEAKEEKNLQT